VDAEEPKTASYEDVSLSATEDGVNLHDGNIAIPTEDRVITITKITPLTINEARDFAKRLIDHADASEKLAQIRSHPAVRLVLQDNDALLLQAFVRSERDRFKEADNEVVVGMLDRVEESLSKSRV
jgi:hydrogenase maturation factor HypF (carbamoyltransferase family)